MGIEVLIVDDSPTTRYVIERILRMSDPNMGTCHHAENGLAALEVMSAHWIDIVFADLHMPTMNGRELLACIRKNDLWRNIPVAVITSECSDETEIELVELGASCYQKKPLTPETIRDVFYALKRKIS